MKQKVASKSQEQDKEKPRIFILETLVNFALIYSIVVAIILIPYLYIRGHFNNILVFWINVVYCLLLLVYIIFWIRDKKEFFKYELRY